jgi:hypothetical protein
VSGSASSIWLEAVHLEKVELLANAISVVAEYQGQASSVSVPFDLIEAAWKTETHWQVLVRGRIKPMQWRPELGIPELERIRLYFDAHP